MNENTLRAWVRIFVYFALIAVIFFILLKFIQGRVPTLPPTPTPPSPSPTSTSARPSPTSTYLSRRVPIIPYGLYEGPSYSHLKEGTTYTYKGIKYLLLTGKEGRLWGITPAHDLVLLYGARSQYDTY